VEVVVAVAVEKAEAVAAAHKTAGSCQTALHQTTIDSLHGIVKLIILAPGMRGVLRPA
jgi:hypothetical protein